MRQDPDWTNFFWSPVSGAGAVAGAGLGGGEDEDGAGACLGRTLLLRLSDLLFCPDFTVATSRSSTRDEVSTVHNILCLSGACTFAATSACDWSTGTH